MQKHQRESFFAMTVCAMSLFSLCLCGENLTCDASHVRERGYDRGMAGFRLECTECGGRYDEDRTLLVCPACASQQMAGGEVRGVLRVVLEAPPARWPGPGELTDPYWLAEVLPVRGPESLAPLAVGGTPLLPAPRLREALGMPWLWLKDDTRNPSGSTKDRASLLVVAKAVEYGFGTIATASTGNAATALAAVAAAAGLRAVVLVPAAAPPAKLVQMASYGAFVVPVDGSYDDAFELAGAACARFGWYNRGTALNPFTIEGKKTAALEIAAQLATEAPDVVVVPAGDGVITAGLAKGFADLVAGGLLARVPRLVIVQPEGSSALVRALGSGAAGATTAVGAASVADSLVVAWPRNARLCLADVRASGGAGVTVSDDAILAAGVVLARLTGVFAEPAAAASLAGLEAARAEDLVGRDERVVLMVTGSGLKDVAAAARSVRLPDPVPPTLDAIAERVQSSKRT